MSKKIQEIVNELSKYQLVGLQNEKKVQEQLDRILRARFPELVREARTKDGVIDFALGEIGIEVKVKGQKAAIFRQLKRYAKTGEFKSILLVTAKSMGLPPEVEGVDLYYFSLSRNNI